MTRAPLWLHFLGWLVLCIALTAAMVITASAQQIAVCDHDVGPLLRLLSAAPDGFKLRKQYYDERAGIWIAEFIDSAGNLIIVKQTLSEAFWTETNQ